MVSAARPGVDVPELRASQPRIIDGDQMTDYVVVGGRDEFDRPVRQR